MTPTKPTCPRPGSCQHSPNSGQNPPGRDTQGAGLSLHGQLRVYEDRQGRAPRAHAVQRARGMLPLPGTVLFIYLSHPTPQPAPTADTVQQQRQRESRDSAAQRSIHLASAESRPRLRRVPIVTLFSLSSQGTTRTTD